MKTMKKLPVFGTALLLAAFLGNAYAEDSDMTQARTQDRLHKDIDLQTPTADFAQDRDRDRIREHDDDESHDQYRNEYKYMNKFQTRQSGAGAGSMSRQYMQGHATSGSRR